MSKRAKEAALKAYPLRSRLIRLARGNTFFADNLFREGFVNGYEQAEKDIITLIESRLSELFGDAQPTPILRYELQDLIKIIKEEEK